MNKVIRMYLVGINGVKRHLVALYRDILEYPLSILFAFLFVSCLAFWQLKYFSFDASAETLVVQGDPKLAFYRQMEQIFGGDEFLIITVNPVEAPLFSQQTFGLIDKLQKELSQIKGVSAVFSILDAPLLRSPPVSLANLDKEYLTLRNERVDLLLAPLELAKSPFFSRYLLSEDLTTTALKIDLSEDIELETFRQQKELLLLKPQRTEKEQQHLADLEVRYADRREKFLSHRQGVIDDVRKLKKKYSTRALIYLGGVPMIAADMISFVKRDILVFGLGVLLLMMSLLYLFFRHVHWVALPVVLGGVSILLTSGLLGFMVKPVTVISSNFILLLMIISISFSVHLIVRYRELFTLNSYMEYKQLVCETMLSKFAPCIYTALTTMVAFSAMMTSQILPVEDFGWMMCIGIVMSFIVTYLMFPALLLVIGQRETIGQVNDPHRFTEMLSSLARKSPGSVVSGGFLLFLIACVGLSQLSFNNRFVDYFAESTEIRQGMEYIDDHLGGTVPFEVYLQYERFEQPDSEDDFFEEENDIYPERYWFTPKKIADVSKLQAYIESKSPTGKVLSVATVEKIARDFNEGNPLTALQISAVLGLLPPAFKSQLIDNFANPESGTMKINARIRESGPYFSRSGLANDIIAYANSNLQGVEVRVSGMMVLFDDMLSQLFNSQINTLIYVIAATFVMFSLLLRSFTLAVIALIPNVIVAATIIAIMGYANVPLDMMTITIAAIVIGIGVDDAIHYLHRFREELGKEDDVTKAIINAHATIGKAMYFTSMVVVGGFSILSLSNFLPTVYFGLLTALAMLLAMFSNLVILPSLLLKTYRGSS